MDTDLYRPEGERFSLATRKAFKFLFVGGTIGRKGIDILLETYREVFSRRDDVCLVIKTNGGNGHYLGMSLDEEIKRMAQDPSSPEIEVIDADLSDAEVAALYRACDALVHPYRGEGFGMPIAEAMASALPVIVTGYGACLDFCDPETAFLIPAREVALEVHALQAPSVGYWYGEPDRAALGQLMRELPSNPGLAKAKGLRARERMIARYQWPQVAEVALERIEELAKRLPVRFAECDPFRMGLAPLRIEERRKVVFFHHADWPASSWHEVLVSYAQAFAKDADVSLALWLDPSQGVGEAEAGLRVLEALTQAGIDPEQAPDILLVPDVLDLEGLARLYAATDCVVPAGDELQVSRATRLGLPLLDDLAPHAWRDKLRELGAKESAIGLNSGQGMPK
ncbi:D-inositol-3-phosphate glycosyltransferase [compost metagenome]